MAAPTLNATGGTVTFNSIPTAPGTITFTVSAADTAGVLVTKSYSIAIDPALTIVPAALSGGDVGVLYSKVITVSNGTTPYTLLNVTGYGAGDTGLAAPTANVGTGTVTFNGAPTASGTVTFTVNATDSAGGTLTKSYTILIMPALTIAPAAMAGGDVGALYSSAITVSNGTTPYTVLSVSGYNDGGTGLTTPTVNAVAGTVIFNSTPTATGAVTFTVNVTDSAGGTLIKNYTIPVSPALSIAPAAMPVDDFGVLDNQVITVSNGTTPYTALAIAGFNSGATGLAAPTVNAAAGTVTFGSVPTAAGIVTFTVNATDTAGGALTKNYTILVNPAVTLSPSVLPGGDVGLRYSSVVAASGGTTPYTALSVTGYNGGGTGLTAPHGQCRGRHGLLQQRTNGSGHGPLHRERDRHSRRHGNQNYTVVISPGHDDRASGLADRRRQRPV